MKDDWPEVTFGGSHKPYIDRVLDEEPYITRPKTVVAYGTVAGYPWSLVLFEKHGDPEDEVDEGPEPSGRLAEFFLGGSPGLPGSQPGGLGGGGGAAAVSRGMHISTTAHSWATNPPLIGYVIFVSSAVGRLEVQVEGAEPRTFEVRHAPVGFPHFCVFFPPFGAAGEIVALDDHGTRLHRRELYSGDLPAGATFGGGD